MYNIIVIAYKIAEIIRQDEASADKLTGIALLVNAPIHQHVGVGRADHKTKRHNNGYYHRIITTMVLSTTNVWHANKQGTDRINGPKAANTIQHYARLYQIYFKIPCISGCIIARTSSFCETTMSLGNLVSSYLHTRHRT